MEEFSKAPLTVLYSYSTVFPCSGLLRRDEHSRLGVVGVIWVNPEMLRTFSFCHLHPSSAEKKCATSENNFKIWGEGINLIGRMIQSHTTCAMLVSCFDLTWILCYVKWSDALFAQNIRLICNIASFVILCRFQMLVYEQPWAFLFSLVIFHMLIIFKFHYIQQSGTWWLALPGECSESGSGRWTSYLSVISSFSWIRSKNLGWQTSTQRPQPKCWQISGSTMLEVSEWGEGGSNEKPTSCVSICVSLFKAMSHYIESVVCLLSVSGVLSILPPLQCSRLCASSSDKRSLLAILALDGTARRSCMEDEWQMWCTP